MTSPASRALPPSASRWLLALGLLALSAPAAAETVKGAQLPDGAVQVGENRYRSPRDFEGTLDYYKAVYPLASHPRKPIVNQPSVKAVHIAFPPGKAVAGLNIYEDKENTREVRIYLVPSESAPAPKKGMDKRKGKK